MQDVASTLSIDVHQHCNNGDVHNELENVDERTSIRPSYEGRRPRS